MGQKTSPSAAYPMFPEGAEAITKSDTVDLTSPSVVYVGGDGNVKVTTANDDVVTFTGLVAGSTIPVRVKRVWSTDTTATNMVRIY